VRFARRLGRVIHVLHDEEIEFLRMRRESGLMNQECEEFVAMTQAFGFFPSSMPG